MPFFITVLTLNINKKIFMIALTHMCVIEKHRIFPNKTTCYFFGTIYKKNFLNTKIIEIIKIQINYQHLQFLDKNYIKSLNLKYY